MDVNDSVAFPLLIIGRGEIKATVKACYDQNKTSGGNPRDNKPREMVKTGRRTQSVKTYKPGGWSCVIHGN